MKFTNQFIDKRSCTWRFQRLHLSILTVFLTGLLLVSQSTSFAQINKLNAGDRVKVKAPTMNNEILIGTVAELSSSAIRIKSKQSDFTIPLGSIENLYVHKGEKGILTPGPF